MRPADHAHRPAVRVTESFTIERYSHVMHIVSNVEGDAPEGLDPVDVLMAALPAGTLSGAPKVRAMQIIDELESEKRGVAYAGAVGYFGADGSVDTCIVLRTGLIKDGLLYVQAGGGVVADSDPDAEYEETLQKSGGLAPGGGRSLAVRMTPATPRGRMILVIDNYDSFTYNLVHYLNELGAETTRPAQRRADASRRRSALRPEAVVLSPGPCTPNEAGICLDLIAAARGRPADPGRLPRAPGDRPGLRRQGRARQDPDARQDQPDPPRGQPASSRACPTASPPPAITACRWRENSLPDDAGGHRLDRRRRDHGLVASRRARSTACSSTRNPSPPRAATGCSPTSSSWPASSAAALA